MTRFAKNLTASQGHKLSWPLISDRDAELAAQNALNKARDKAVASEWAAYNFYLGAAEQIMAQYGSSSDEYASIGYKKKSEYKKTTPGKAKKANENTVG